MTDFWRPWDRPGWLEEVQAWIRFHLVAHGVHLAGPIQQPHNRPWSTVLTAPTDQGLFYFKASAPVLAHEAALTAFIARLRPEISPRLLAVDEERSWMLMADCGQTLRSFIRGERSLARWKDILPQYTALQKTAAARVDYLLRMGVFDRRLAGLPDQFDALIADESALLMGQPEGLSKEEVRRLRSLRADFTRLCADLADFAIPESLHHDDFHDGNLFLSEGRVIFTDWGEAALAHPFFTLVVLLRGAENSLGLDEHAPELDQVRGWYLAEWAEFGSEPELRYAASLAERIGLVNRALTWRRVIQSMPHDQCPAYAPAVPGYLKDFLHGPG